MCMCIMCTLYVLFIMKIMAYNARGKWKIKNSIKYSIDKSKNAYLS